MSDQAKQTNKTGENQMKTIDLQAKEWFDKANGNSYFSAELTIDFTLPTEKRLTLPFQYGYGSHYEDIARDKLVEDGLITLKSNYQSLWRYCSENGVKFNSSKQENCKKRELIGA